MRKKWMLKRIGADYEGLGKIFGLDPLVIRILVNRGYDTEEKIRLFLSADETIFDCADGLPDIGSAVSALERFRKEGKKIRIIGDYDIDGVCATAILLKALK
ncbi:MAG: single-stranded-DNA-specific exonuclease RecJ, partial [Lachnospiraceae bacterium]|nr:single-stranded-DNA-specific exonuclease RecJ [Lachnospiraceae bacterium]